MQRLSALSACLVWAVLIVFVQPAVPGAGDAEAAGTSLQERRHQREQQRRLDDEAAFTSNVCNTRISASIHWDSFNSRGGTLNVVGFCDVALSAIERICRETPGKVQSRIRHLECGAGERRAVQLNGGTVKYAVGPRPSREDFDYVYKTLKRKL